MSNVYAYNCITDVPCARPAEIPTSMANAMIDIRNMVLI